MGTYPSSPWCPIGKLLAIREVNVLLALVLIGASISLFTPYFLTTNNIMGVFRSFSMVGLVFGLVNGLLVTGIGLPPFIATLGTLSVGRGLMYMITHGVPVTPDAPAAFAFIGQGYVGPVPAPVVTGIDIYASRLKRG